MSRIFELPGKSCPRCLFVFLILWLIAELQVAGAADSQLKLSSPAFSEGQRIPFIFAKQGQNINPALSWSNIPSGTKEIVLLVDDPDAPRVEPWVHWVVYRLPANVSRLEAGIHPGRNVAGVPGALQGLNSSGQLGYEGPFPPKGAGLHHYRFTVYALSSESMPEQFETRVISRRHFLESEKGKILAEATLTGTYSQ